MKICDYCLNADICSMYEDNFMDSAIKNGFCGKFRDEKLYIHVPCKTGDVVWDKEGTPLEVLTIEKFPDSIHLHCEHRISHKKKTLYVGRSSIGRTVFLSYQSFRERQEELNKRN